MFAAMHYDVPFGVFVYNKVVPVEETAPDPSGGALVWAMRVKQGFKCKVFGTPECDPNAVRLCVAR